VAVVEASLGALLAGVRHALHSSGDRRIAVPPISFWYLVRIGWVAWGLLEVAERCSSTRHHPWAVDRHGR
jgi:hypothetical protein